jgi:hypothetical protein
MSSATLYHQPARQNSVPAQGLASEEQQCLQPSVQSACAAQRLVARGKDPAESVGLGGNVVTPGPAEGPAGDGGTALGGVRRGNSLAERGYVQARFGDVPVLIGPDLAAQLRAMRQVP